MDPTFQEASHFSTPPGYNFQCVGYLH